MIKKYFSLLISGAIASASWVSGGPLIQSEIAKDAKWLAHIDMEGMMASSFSEFGVSKLKEIIAESNESKLSIDIDLVLQEILSITAYGADFGEEAAGSSVIILKTGDRMQAIFDGLVAHHEMEEEESPLKRVEGMPYESYVLGDELYIAFPHKNYAVAGKSFDEIEKAYAVIEGDSESLEDSEEKLILNEDGGFFLLVTAKGLDSVENMPAQARVFQKTKGGQFSIGEVDGNFRANVMLSTANAKISEQLSRIVNGLLALVSFSQVENQSMMEIVDSVYIGKGDDFVSLDFAYPVEKIMDLIQSLVEMADDGDQKSAEIESSSSQWDPKAREQTNLYAFIGHG